MKNVNITESGFLSDNQVMVLLIPEEDYLQQLLKVVTQLADEANRICFISLNRPYTSLTSLFEKNNVDAKKFYFIDAITKTAELPPETENCSFISSPGALTELSVEVSSIIENEEFDYLLFDSLSTLIVYETDAVITKFIHFLMAKVRVASCKAIFTCLKQDMQTNLIRDINMFADKIIDLDKWAPSLRK